MKTIDTELIKMCDCPEIQDRWEPKVGDRVADRTEHMWIIIRVLNVACMNRQRIEVLSIPNGRTDTIYAETAIYIPRIEDVLEWCDNAVPEHWGLKVQELISLIYRQRWYEDDTFLHGLLKAYMHLEHSKTWDGEVWK
jgi:hypothetical protein